VCPACAPFFYKKNFIASLLLVFLQLTSLVSRGAAAAIDKFVNWWCVTPAGRRLHRTLLRLCCGDLAANTVAGVAYSEKACKERRDDGVVIGGVGLKVGVGAHILVHDAAIAALPPLHTVDVCAPPPPSVAAAAATAFDRCLYTGRAALVPVIVVLGPVGCGKSTTATALERSLNDSSDCDKDASDGGGGGSRGGSEDGVVARHIDGDSLFVGEAAVSAMGRERNVFTEFLIVKGKILRCLCCTQRM
jgi:hypothetical protein